MMERASLSQDTYSLRDLHTLDSEGELRHDKNDRKDPRRAP